MMAYVSSLSVAGVCPELVEVTRKWKGKEEKVFLVNDDIHLALVELVIKCFLVTLRGHCGVSRSTFTYVHKYKL